MTTPKSDFGFTDGIIYGMNREHKLEDFKVFNWDKAATYIKQNNVKNAEAGLEGDWEYTGGSIFSDGQVDMDGYTYLESSWAIPHLYDLDSGTMIECYTSSSDNPQKWTSETKWPESALKIIND